MASGDPSLASPERKPHDARATALLESPGLRSWRFRAQAGPLQGAGGRNRSSPASLTRRPARGRTHPAWGRRAAKGPQCLADSSTLPILRRLMVQEPGAGRLLVSRAGPAHPSADRSTQRCRCTERAMRCAMRVVQGAMARPWERRARPAAPGKRFPAGLSRAGQVWLDGEGGQGSVDSCGLLCCCGAVRASGADLPTLRRGRMGTCAAVALAAQVPVAGPVGAPLSAFGGLRSPLATQDFDRVAVPPPSKTPRSSSQRLQAARSPTTCPSQHLCQSCHTRSGGKPSPRDFDRTVAGEQERHKRCTHQQQEDACTHWSR